MCRPATCANGAQDAGEHQTDCGGPCRACAVGQLCDGHGDCLSETCIFGVCTAPSCDDGVRNGGETDADCGGDCEPCADGKRCAGADDCASGRCTNERCTSCEDGVNNGDESDVDCGGDCEPCAAGLTCTQAADCASTYCCDGVCQPGTEVDHCGGCGACPSDPHGTPVCDAGTCQLQCATGYHLCDGRCADDTSAATCGSRCAPCPGTAHGEAVCDGGACGLVCDAGYHRCGDQCVANSSVATCGSSCSPCPSPAHGTATCDGEQCGIDCDAGYHDCSGQCVSSSSVDHCGDSCQPCAPAGLHATLSCEAGQCTYQCASDALSCGVDCMTPAELGDALTESTYLQPSHDEVAEALGAADDGRLLIAGAEAADGGGQRAWLLGLNADATVAWQSSVDPPAGATRATALAATADPGGGWVVAGRFSTATSAGTGWIATVTQGGSVGPVHALDDATGVDVLEPLAEGGLLAAGAKAGNDFDKYWYGKVTSAGAVTWQGAIDASWGEGSAAALPGGGAVVIGVADPGTHVRFVASGGQTLHEGTVSGIRAHGAVGLPGGGAVLFGQTTDSPFHPAPLWVDATATAVGDVHEFYHQGLWSAASVLPDGGLVLGGRRDAAAGWNPLLFALSDASGTITWNQQRYNDHLELYSVWMKEAILLPTGGYAWLATTDEAYGVDADDARLFRIVCSGAAGPVDPPQAGGVVISEILYDSVGADTDVFVELQGPPGTPLSGYQLVGVNGNGGADYKAVTLTGAVGADGRYVVTHPQAAAWISAASDQTADVDYQNGPDSVQLRSPSGVVVDAVGYGSFSAGTVFAGEGNPAPAAESGESLTRDAAATDTDDNSVDFTATAAPTPGS